MAYFEIQYSMRFLTPWNFFKKGGTSFAHFRGWFRPPPPKRDGQLFSYGMETAFTNHVLHENLIITDKNFVSYGTFLYFRIRGTLALARNFLKNGPYLGENDTFCDNIVPFLVSTSFPYRPCVDFQTGTIHKVRTQSLVWLGGAALSVRLTDPRCSLLYKRDFGF